MKVYSPIKKGEISVGGKVFRISHHFVDVPEDYLKDILALGDLFRMAEPRDDRVDIPRNEAVTTPSNDPELSNDPVGSI